MLPEPFMDHELPCKLMVNGIPVQSVHIRCGFDSSDGFRVLSRPNRTPSPASPGLDDVKSLDQKA